MTHPPDHRTEDRLVRLVELWHLACMDFLALVREIPRGQWDLPTDLEGWTVKDNVAHTAHLEVAQHVLSTFGRALPMVVGKRLAPAPGTTVRLAVPDADLVWAVTVGDDGRAIPVDSATAPTSAITLSPEDFVMLAGGRRAPEATAPVFEDDEDLGRRLLASMAMTP